MVKIRLEGTADECRDAAARLPEIFDVVSESEPYPNRGKSLLVRVYVEIRLDSSTNRCQDSGNPP